jgi:hypothetical protein
MKALVVVEIVLLVCLVSLISGTSFIVGHELGGLRAEPQLTLDPALPHLIECTKEVSDMKLRYMLCTRAFAQCSGIEGDL